MIGYGKTHEEAVKSCNEAVKKLEEMGYQINAISWFDENRFHINWSSSEDIKNQKKHAEKIKEKIRQILKENPGWLSDPTFGLSLKEYKESK